MTAIFVVRHPQTTWNATERYQGRLEAPLSEEGEAQAAAIASTFAGSAIDVVYTSPLRRAADLGRRIADATGAPLRPDHRLTEIAMGPWEGLYRRQIVEQFPEIYNRWYTDPAHVHFPEGESLRDVSRRAESVLSDIFSRHPDGYVVLTTHSVVAQTIVMLALDVPDETIHRIRISNGSISTVCGTEAPGSLLSMNVTDHLFGSPRAAAAQQNCVSWKERRMTV